MEEEKTACLWRTSRRGVVVKNCILFDWRILFRSLLWMVILVPLDVCGDAPHVENPVDELSLKPNTLFVSLGCSCLVASHLRRCGLRREAFPFDWLLTIDGERLIELIDNNFKDFLDEQYLVRHPYTETGLFHSYYYIEFRHDWPQGSWDPDKYLGALERLRSKYARRIERFNALNHFPGKVFFIRSSGRPKPYWPTTRTVKVEIDREWALALNRVLKKRFPNLDFTLVLLKPTGDEEEIEMIDDIILFNLSKLKAQYPFRKIFEILQSGILSSSSRTVSAEKDNLNTF
jgi:hypothetical protein